MSPSFAGDPQIFLKKLVSIKSFSKQEGTIEDQDSVVGHVYQELEDLENFQVFTQEVGTNSQNLIAAYLNNSQSTNSTTLVISAHLDTVPPGPADSWYDSDPFSGKTGWVQYLGNNKVELHVGDSSYNCSIRDQMDKVWKERETEKAEIIYGRGSFDNKASVAILLSALKGIDVDLSEGDEINGNLIVLFNVDEEIDGTGIKQFAGWGENESWVANHVDMDKAGKVYGLVTEGSYGFIPGVGHKGIGWFSVATRGKSAHASTPELGRNAVTDMCSILCYLNKHRREIIGHDLKSIMNDPLLGEPSLALGTTIYGGGIENIPPDQDIETFSRSNINSIPDFCKSTLDIRLVRGDNHPADVDQVPLKIKTLLQDRIEHEVDFEGNFSIDFDKQSHFYPAAIADTRKKARNHPLVKACLNISGKIQGFRPWIMVAPGASDAGFLQQGIGPQVMAEFGPAGGLSHEVHEYVEIQQLQFGVRIFQEIIAELLG